LFAEAAIATFLQVKGLSHHWGLSGEKSSLWVIVPQPPLGMILFGIMIAVAP